MVSPDLGRRRGVAEEANVREVAVEGVLHALTEAVRQGVRIGARRAVDREAGRPVAEPARSGEGRSVGRFSGRSLDGWIHGIWDMIALNSERLM